MTKVLPLRPSKIRLEASSHCQLRCPSCPTATGKIDAEIGRGYLRVSDFERLIDISQGIDEVELSNYGEIFLNPELPEILRVGWERGVRLSAGNGVNLNDARPEALEAIVRYRLTTLNVSIDGASADTYAKYRVRGDFDAVLGNVRTIIAHKQRLGLTLPSLRWQFIVFGHNEHELPLARRMADELGMEFFAKLSWDEGFSPVLNLEAVRLHTGVMAASRSEFQRVHERSYMDGICDQLWTSPQVNWDGAMLGCCRNYWGNFGTNVFANGLYASVNSEKMNYARQMLQGEMPARDDIPCATCSLYKDRSKAKRWLKRKSVATDQRD